MARTPRMVVQRTLPKFILASASPRRRDLLGQIGIVPDEVVAADIDETPWPNELPRPHAERLARDKAAHVAKLHPDAFVLAGDTVVACGRRILPKAETEAQARDCLALLSGRRHDVLTAIALARPGADIQSRVVPSVVSFKRLTQREIDGYIESGEWHGKAGGYAIQGRGAAFVRNLRGSYSGVVGLPLYELAQILGGAGYPVL